MNTVKIFIAKLRSLKKPLQNESFATVLFVIKDSFLFYVLTFQLAASRRSPMKVLYKPSSVIRLS